MVTKQRVYQLAAKSHTDMTEWMKMLSLHTILHAENELIVQAEEMIAKATYDHNVRAELEANSKRTMPEETTNQSKAEEDGE